jgi:hypothetical protein
MAYTVIELKEIKSHQIPEVQDPPRKRDITSCILVTWLVGLVLLFATAYLFKILFGFSRPV